MRKRFSDLYCQNGVLNFLNSFTEQVLDDINLLYTGFNNKSVDCAIFTLKYNVKDLDNIIKQNQDPCVIIRDSYVIPDIKSILKQSNGKVISVDFKQSVNNEFNVKVTVNYE